MHLFTVGESITKGIRLHRDGLVPYLAQSPYSAVSLTLSEDLESFVSEQVPTGNLLLLEEATVVCGTHQGLTTICLAGGRPASQQALVRVEMAAGVGGRIALLPRTRTDFSDGRPWQKYNDFPPDGVQFLGSDEDAAAAHQGLHPSMDVLLIMSPGGCFSLERTGDLSDQDGNKLPEAVSMFWDGENAKLRMRVETYSARPEAWVSVIQQSIKSTHARTQQWQELRATA